MFTQTRLTGPDSLFPIRHQLGGAKPPETPLSSPDYGVQANKERRSDLNSVPVDRLDSAPLGGGSSSLGPPAAARPAPRPAPRRAPRRAPSCGRASVRVGRCVSECESVTLL